MPGGTSSVLATSSCQHDPSLQLTYGMYGIDILVDFCGHGDPCGLDLVDTESFLGPSPVSEAPKALQ